MIFFFLECIRENKRFISIFFTTSCRKTLFKEKNWRPNSNEDTRSEFRFLENYSAIIFIMLANHLNAQTGKNGGLNIMDIEA